MDPDLPAQQVSLELLPGAPTGVALDPGTGAFSWTPDESQTGNHAVGVRAIDDGSPPLASEFTYAIVVKATNETLVWLDFFRPAPGTIGLRWEATVSKHYQVQSTEDPSVPAWQDDGAPLEATSPQMTHLLAVPAQQRFYRVVQVD